jgi:hypothetical protein
MPKGHMRAAPVGLASYLFIAFTFALFESIKAIYRNTAHIFRLHACQMFFFVSNALCSLIEMHATYFYHEEKCCDHERYNRRKTQYNDHLRESNASPPGLRWR